MFDPQCYELAEYFLPDDANKNQKDGLAQAIQDVVEDYLRDIEDVALIELPNGDFINPKTVVGVRTMVGDSMGPRVLLDVTTPGQVLLIEFNRPEAARAFAREFAGKVNAAFAVS